MSRLYCTQAIFVFILLLHTTPSATAQIRWMPDETVRAGTGTDVKMGFNNTQVLATIGLTRFITWIRGDSLVVASSVNGGAWSVPVLVSRVNAPAANLPTLAALSDGKLCAGWTESAGVRASFSSDGGKTWATAQTLASKGSGLCLAAGEGGVLYVLWHSGGDEEPSDMMFSVWQNGAWATPRVIDAAPATNTAVWGSLCVVGTTLFAVWRENTTGEFRVYLTRSTNGGATWETPRNIVKDDRSGDPTVAFSSGQVIVAYQRAQQIYTVTSGDAAGTIFNAPNLIGPGLFARVIAKDNGRIALVWERFTGANGKNDQVKQTGFVYSTDYGFTFSKDSALTPMGSKLGLVNFSGTNELTVSWLNTNSGGSVMTKRATLLGVTPVNAANAASMLGLNANMNVAPNPATEQIIVRFSLPNPERATLKVFNALGVEVASLLDAMVNAGEHEQSFAIGQWSLASGTYFLQLKTQHSTLNTIPIQVLR